MASTIDDLNQDQDTNGLLTTILKVPKMKIFSYYLFYN